MPEPKAMDAIQAIRDLLREGRTNEADRQLDEMQKKIREEEEQRKRDMPPPSPMTKEELLTGLLQEIVTFLGLQPRQVALVQEYAAQNPKPEPA
jgi:hypothetical protein